MRFALNRMPDMHHRHGWGAYAGFGDAQSDAIANLKSVMQKQIAQMQSVSQHLTDVVLRYPDPWLKGRVDQWQSQEQVWESDSVQQAVIDHPDRATGDVGWITIGSRMIDQAKEIAASDPAEDPAFANGLSSFADTFVSDMKAALDAVTSALQSLEQHAGTILQTGAWEIVKPLLILGGAAALIFFLINKSGGKINAGPVRIGEDG